MPVGRWHKVCQGSIRPYRRERHAAVSRCQVAVELFGGIRDAAPDAWGRRVIEAKLKVPANSLPESQYLLHAGSDRVGALDIRESIHVGPVQGTSVSLHLQHLMEAADRIEEGLPVPAHLEAVFVDGTALGGAPVWTWVTACATGEAP